MTYVPQSKSLLAAPYKLVLMIANSPTARELLEADSPEDAVLRMTTYSEDEFPCPRCVMLEQPIRTRTSNNGKTITDVDARQIGAEFFVYVPNDFYSPPEGQSVTRMDEFNWLGDKLSDIQSELAAMSGEPGNLILNDPTIFERETIPFSERFDESETDKGDEARSLWYAVMSFRLE